MPSRLEFARRHRPMRRRAVLALAGALSLFTAGCGLTDVRVTVVNASGQPLDSLVIAGEGHATRVKPLAPGQSRELRIAVNGEDALALRGRMGGRRLVPQMAAYVEDGYRLRLEVDPHGVVQVETHAAY